MSDDNLDAQAQILVLARLLRVEPDDLQSLRSLPPDAIRALREQATDVLFDANKEMFQRLASGAMLLPASITAKVAQGAFGPLLCARVAGRLKPDKGVEVAAKLEPEFLVDVSLEIDPRRVAEIISRMERDAIVAVARGLLERREHVAMGLFVPQLDDAAIVACMDMIDDESLLRIAFVLDDKTRLDHVMGLLDDAALERVMKTGLERDLLPEIANIAYHVSPELRAKIAGALGPEHADAVAPVEAPAARGE